MLTKKQLKIFNIFQKNTFRESSYRQVKELSDEKSNSVVQNSIKAFLKEKLITEKAIGTSKLYTINHENDKAYLYFSIFNKENIQEKVEKTIKELKNSLDKHILFYSIVLFGSYADNTYKKDSDLDIAVFIENDDKRKITEAVFKSIELKAFLKVDGHVITKDEFLEMLKVDYENLGKEIARKHLIIHNPSIFYSMLRESIKHGFKL